MENEITINTYNPNTQYYLIKQNINNLNIDLEGFDEFIDKPFIKNVQKLDIFRSVMQYAESFFLFLFAKINKETSMESITTIKIETVLTMSNYFKLGEFDDYCSNTDVEFENFYELITDIFNIEEVEKIDEIKKILTNISYFYEFYKDAYNSIKHGLRLIEKKFTHAKIDSLAENFEIIDDYVEIFCNFKNRIYSLLLPISIVFNESLGILEEINEIFNFLMRTNKYENQNNFDYQSKTQFSQDYVKITTNYDKCTIIFPKNEKLEQFQSSSGNYHYAKLDFNGRSKLTISLNQDPSYDFPFNILLDEDNWAMEPRQIIKNILIDHSLILNPQQIRILKKVNEKIESNSQIIIEFDNNNEIVASENIHIIISDDLKEYDENILQSLKILENFGDIEEIPFNLTNEAKNKLLEFKNSSNKPEIANSTIEYLKNSAKHKEEAYIIIRENNEIIDTKYIGYSFNEFNYQFIGIDNEGRESELICNHGIKFKEKEDVYKFINGLSETFIDGELTDDLKNYSLKKGFYMEQFLKMENTFKEKILLFNFEINP